MLKAKFLKMAKNGDSAIYEVQGTSAELDNFVANNYKKSKPLFKSTIDGKPILDAQGNKVPLYFTSYPLPGQNIWHPMYQVQTGDRAGSWTLNKQDLQFDMLVAKSTGGDLGQAIAAKAAERWVAPPVSSSTSALLAEDDDDDEEDDFTAEEESSDVEANLEELPKKTVRAQKP